MKIEMVDLDRIRFYEKNSKAHPTGQVEKIARSIDAFGFNVPVLIDREFSLVAGHGRCMAAKRLGFEQVPAVRVEHLTVEQVRAYRIADNKTAESEWLEDMLAEELLELKSLEFDLTLTGFDTDEVLHLIGETDSPGNTDPDDVPDLPEAPVTTSGVLYLLGDHRLLCGDSTCATDVDKLLGGGAAKVNDYGSALRGRVRRKLALRGRGKRASCLC